MSKQTFIANPKHTESDWRMIANTVHMSMTMTNFLEVKYYMDSDVHTVVGKVYDVDNMDKQLTMKVEGDYYVIPYDKIIFAIIKGGE